MISRMAAGLLVLLVAGSAAAQNVSVSYLEGDARVGGGAAWRELSIGDRLPSEAVLRVGESSYVELATAGVAILLSQPGTYSVRNLLSARRRLDSAGVGKALGASLSTLLWGSSRREATSAGVRSPQAGPNVWSGLRDTDQAGGQAREDAAQAHVDPADAYREAADGYLEAGDHGKAIEQLRLALGVAPDDERTEIRFHLASALALDGDTRAALKEIESLPADLPYEWAPDLVLLRGRLLIDTFAFDPAVQWLRGHAGDLPVDPLRSATWFFLLGVAYGGIGDAPNQRACLSRVVELGQNELGERDLVEAATRLLQDP